MFYIIIDVILSEDEIKGFADYVKKRAGTFIPNPNDGPEPCISFPTVADLDDFSTDFHNDYIDKGKGNLA